MIILFSIFNVVGCTYSVETNNKTPNQESLNIIDRIKTLFSKDQKKVYEEQLKQYQEHKGEKLNGRDAQIYLLLKIIIDEHTSFSDLMMSLLTNKDDNFTAIFNALHTYILYKEHKMYQAHFHVNNISATMKNTTLMNDLKHQVFLESYMKKHSKEINNDMKKKFKYKFDIQMALHHIDEATKAKLMQGASSVKKAKIKKQILKLEKNNTISFQTISPYMKLSNSPYLYDLIKNSDQINLNENEKNTQYAIIEYKQDGKKTILDKQDSKKTAMLCKISNIQKMDDSIPDGAKMIYIHTNDKYKTALITGREKEVEQCKIQNINLFTKEIAKHIPESKKQLLKILDNKTTKAS